MRQRDLYTWNTDEDGEAVEAEGERRYIYLQELSKALEMVERELDMKNFNALAKKYRSDT